MKGRCDSFVVETDVHFPTDISLLFDAMRKVIQHVAELCKRHKASDWRQYQATYTSHADHTKEKAKWE